MNELIEQIFSNFSVPVSFMRYDGKATTYITYQQTDIDTTLSADDELINYLDYYDFDIYSKGNIEAIITAVIEKMKSAGFTWEPSRTSPDFYEPDTGYYHKTLNFAILREV